MPTDPFIGEISTIGFNFAPKDWSLCHGQSVQVSENPALYSLLGSTFGGNGTTYFMLPNLQGRTPIGIDPGAGLDQGYSGGQENVAIDQSTLGAHRHTVQGSSETADKPIVNPNGEFALASGTSEPLYHTPTNLTELSPINIQNSPGSGQAHNNIQPSLVIYFIIAMQGTYPSRN